MPLLAETQTAIRGAIIDKDAAAVLPRLTGGSDPTYRLSIHQRHYTASLVEALRRRFPTLDWLVGSAFFNAAAIAFVRRSPPRAPCLAEYGEDFPQFLAGRSGAQRLPWIASVGALEWRLGMVSVAIDRLAVGLDAMTAFEDADLEDLRLRLQPGVAHMTAEWPVDDIVKLRLSGDAPETYEFRPAEVRLEIRGARGAFAIDRLEPGVYAFRATLAGDRSIADALAEAGKVDASFDAGVALAALFSDSLVTGIHVSSAGPGA